MHSKGCIYLLLSLAEPFALITADAIDAVQIVLTDLQNKLDE